MVGHEDNLGPPSPAKDVPPQTRRRVPVAIADRIVRQVEAIDAWNAARRMREDLLEAGCTSRLNREYASRQRDALRRTQRAIHDSTARQLARDDAPRLLPVVTAVVAHGHAWFAKQVAAHLEVRGITVVECTDNGPDALGAVIAEQPDVVLVGDRLAMLPESVLLAETHRFAPYAYRAVQTTDPRKDPAWVRQADGVFLRHQPPSEIATLLALCVAPRTQRTNA